MLEIKNLHAGVKGKMILHGVDLKIKQGEMHVIMGRNGSGKSTLSNVITGRDGYEITAGDIVYKGESILDWSPENRALAGIFMSFQYPVVIPGVNNTYFLKAAVNSKRKHNGEKELDAANFLKLIKEKLTEMDMEPEYLQRAVNEGFSGGEKKRNEILQLLCLEPELSIMDETDSGLDIDALKIVAKGINKYRNEQRSFLVITHYQRLLKYIHPDNVHVLIDGKIVRSGNKDLAIELEEKGYRWLESA
ncbi:MAG: Fe-S cluster assembly ATPase SufC [Chloroflexi bacterium]|jgi:Fe-S cluster assembly ATP-binding protein|nr:Fe-S cluster assembly ATPase SufC [Chloroflexota bacterium]|tara:strand:+ start:1307 stop:2050 length:744 start_codon:yes stop_codon:yes gene_type:complete